MAETVHNYGGIPPLNKILIHILLIFIFKPLKVMNKQKIAASDSHIENRCITALVIFTIWGVLPLGEKSAAFR